MNKVKNRMPTPQKLKLLFLVVAILAGATANAADLKSAKQAGYIGERADGYIGLVDSAIRDA